MWGRHQNGSQEYKSTTDLLRYIGQVTYSCCSFFTTCKYPTPLEVLSYMLQMFESFTQKHYRTTKALSFLSMSDIIKASFTNVNKQNFLHSYCSKQLSQGKFKLKNLTVQFTLLYVQRPHSTTICRLIGCSLLCI